MKLLLNLFISLIIVLSTAFAATNACCCMDSSIQTLSKTEANSKASHQMHCYNDNSSDTGHVHHDKCQCDHHTTSNLPSITINRYFSSLETTIVLATITPPLLSHHLDNIYRPPISA